MNQTLILRGNLPNTRRIGLKLLLLFALVLLFLLAKADAVWACSYSSCGCSTTPCAAHTKGTCVGSQCWISKTCGSEGTSSGPGSTACVGHNWDAGVPVTSGISGMDTSKYDYYKVTCTQNGCGFWYWYKVAKATSDTVTSSSSGGSTSGTYDSSNSTGGGSGSDCQLRYDYRGGFTNYSSFPGITWSSTDEDAGGVTSATLKLAKKTTVGPTTFAAGTTITMGSTAWTSLWSYTHNGYNQDTNYITDLQDAILTLTYTYNNISYTVVAKFAYWGVKGTTYTSSGTQYTSGTNNSLMNAYLRKDWNGEGFICDGGETVGSVWSTLRTMKSRATSHGILNQYIQDSTPEIASILAVWTPVTYTITLNKQSGSGGTDTFYELYGTGFYSNSGCTTKITSISVPTKSNYTFAGYYTKSQGQGTQCVNSSGKITASNTTFSSNTTLYAKWTYTITYNANGGSGSMASTTGVYGTALALRENAFTRDGYAFIGWSTSKNGSVEYLNQKTVKNLGNITLYAVWDSEAAGVFTITLDKQGGTSGTSVFYELCTYGYYSNIACTKTIASVTRPTRDGYVFGGYYSGKNGV